jgi:hypothetical protein
MPVTGILSNPVSVLSACGRRIRRGYLAIIVLVVLGTSPVHAQAGRRAPADPKSVSVPPANAVKKSTITYQVIPANDHTWGYQILVDNTIMIKQATLPGLPGSNGFATKKAAEDVAKLVITKMKKGEMPPTITIDEMKKLKAI